MELQFIGADLGRGFVKGYTEYDGKVKNCMFKSVVGDGRDIDFSEYEKPMYLSIYDEPLYFGELAEKESHNPLPNYSDDKTSVSAQKLLYGLLSELAESEFVRICIGVPNKNFNKETLDKVGAAYNGKKVIIKDNIKNTTKVINIVRVDIFRESDAALLHVINNHPERATLKDKRLGMVTVGFRTTELTYFDLGMKFNEKLSDTREFANKTVLDAIAYTLKGKGISKELNEIDADPGYDDLKKLGYVSLLEKVNQEVEMKWVNYKEMKIFMAGGTALNFKNIPAKFELISDPQLTTAKGLYFVAQKRG